MDYEFTKHKVDHHVESVQVLAQPPIDAAADRIHLQEFYNRVSERQPKLFDSLSQSPSAFEIKKLLKIQGRGQVELTTFGLGPRGPVLSFPRKLPFLEDDVVWPQDLTQEVVSCLETLMECHHTLKVLQVTKRREVIFTTEQHDSSIIIRERFAGGVPDRTQDVVVRWNDCNDIYDRRVTLTAVQRREVVVQDINGVPIKRQKPTGEYGIQVILQVANRDTARPLDSDQMGIILNHADTYYNEVLLKVLNGAGDEDKK